MGKTFGVEDFAKLAGVETATARGMLRRASAKKKGKVYEFSSKTEMQTLIDKSRSAKKPEKKRAKKAPAKKVKKAAKKKAPKEDSPAE